MQSAGAKRRIRLATRQGTQIKRSNGAIALPGPLGEDKAFRTFPTNDRSEETEYQKWQCRGQRVNNKALHSCDRRDLRICEKNPRTKCYRNGTLQSANEELSRGKEEAAARFPRKH